MGKSVMSTEYWWGWETESTALGNYSRRRTLDATMRSPLSVPTFRHASHIFFFFLANKRHRRADSLADEEVQWLVYGLLCDKRGIIAGNRDNVGGQSTLRNPLMDAHVADYPWPSWGRCRNFFLFLTLLRLGWDCDGIRRRIAKRKCNGQGAKDNLVYIDYIISERFWILNINCAGVLRSLSFLLPSDSLHLILFPRIFFSFLGGIEKS